MSDSLEKTMVDDLLRGEDTEICWLGGRLGGRLQGALIGGDEHPSGERLDDDIKLLSGRPDIE